MSGAQGSTSEKTQPPYLGPDALRVAGSAVTFRGQKIRLSIFRLGNNDYRLTVGQHTYPQWFQQFGYAFSRMCWFDRLNETDLEHELAKLENPDRG